MLSCVQIYYFFVSQNIFNQLFLRQQSHTFSDPNVPYVFDPDSLTVTAHLMVVYLSLKFLYVTGRDWSVLDDAMCVFY